MKAHGSGETRVMESRCFANPLSPVFVRRHLSGGAGMEQDKEQRSGSFVLGAVRKDARSPFLFVDIVPAANPFCS